jgi:hypothetical protein
MVDTLAPFIASPGLIISTVVSIIAIISGIYKGIHWLDTQARLKAEEQKRVTEEQAAKVAKTLDEKAEIIRKQGEVQYTDTLKRITGIEEKVIALATRADLSNGNYEKLRGFVINIQADVNDIYDIIASGTSRGKKKIRTDRDERRTRVDRERSEDF